MLPRGLPNSQFPPGQRESNPRMGSATLRRGSLRPQPCHARPRAGTSGQCGEVAASALGCELPGNQAESLRHGTPSLTMNGSEDVPVSYPKTACQRCHHRRNPCKRAKADARTRTGDPFITSEGRPSSPVRRCPLTPLYKPNLATAAGLKRTTDGLACSRGVRTRRREECEALAFGSAPLVEDAKARRAGAEPRN
jgi:hypothetical protein